MPSLTYLERLCGELGLLPDDAAGVVQQGDVVLAADVGHDVLVEELQHQGDAVGEDQVLGHELELVNVVDLEVLEEQEKDGGDGLDDDLLVSVHVYPELHGLHDGHGHLLGQDVRHDVDGVCLGLGGGGGRQEDLEKGDHVLGQGGQHGLVQ